MIFNFSKLVVRLKDANINVIGKKDQYFVAVTRPEVVLIKCFFGLGYSHSRLYKKFFGFVSKHKPFYDADGTIFFDKFASEFEKDQALKIHQKDPEYFHIKDPFVYSDEVHDYLFYNSIPYCWSSSNTGFVSKTKNEINFANNLSNKMF